MHSVIKCKRTGTGQVVDTKTVGKHTFNKQKWTKRKTKNNNSGEITFQLRVKTFSKNNAKT